MGRFDMNSDGVSYLDIGDAYFRGEWRTAINGYFSPLYSWVLGLANGIVAPSAYWEFPLAHLVNLVIFLGAVLSFDFFLRQLIDHERRTEGAWPAWAWILLGYGLFAWSSLGMLNVRLVSPDMLVAATVYLAAGILLRLASQGHAAPRAVVVGLGVVLGFGCLAKGAMLPLACVFLLASGFLAGTVRRATMRVSLALLGLLAVAGPFLVALSLSKGRPTAGDVGKLNYGWYDNGVDLKGEALAVFRRHWQGEPPGSGVPLHPTRKIADHPPIYEFATPVGGTYPLWYDPSYWYTGLRVHFSIREQVTVAASSARWYYATFVGVPFGSLIREGPSVKLLSHVRLLPLVLMCGWVVLAYQSRRRWSLGRDLLKHWFLALPGLAALTMYSLVLVEERYIAPFVMLICASAFAALRLPEPWGTVTRRTLILVPSAVLAITALGVVSAPSSAPLAWRIADGVRRLDARPDRKIASLQYANMAHGAWARLARARIVAEIFPDGEGAFWTAPDSVKARVLQTFAAAGADIVVATAAPAGAVSSGWRPIGETGYFAYFLK
jgi:hypothetical protein